MGRISDDDVQRVREATDLVALVGERVVLRQKGRLWWGCCPFHSEKTPSFKVDPGTQLFHCFGCGAGGDAFGFLMRTENLEFPEAVRVLADRSRIEIAESEGAGVPRSYKERLIAASTEAAEFYHRYLVAAKDESPERARAYLARRDFGSDVAKRWTLGFAPGRGVLVRHLKEKGFTNDEIVGANLGLVADGGQLRDRFYERVMFPISDLQGRVIAFGGRVIGDGEPKYLNTQETPIFHKGRNLYAIDKAKAEIVATGSAVVVEGYTDVIALHEAGIRNVVATLGTALTRDHVRLLGRFAKRVVYLFDGDAAGLRAADRAVEFVDRSITPEAGRDRVELFVAVLPGGADPADFVGSEGAEAMATVLAGAEPLLKFAIDRRLARYDLGKPEERARGLKDAAAILAPVKESTLAADYANYIADVMQSGAGRGLALVDTESVLRAVQNAKVAPPQPEEGGQAQPERVPDIITPQIRAERELVGLVALELSLRPKARELLTNDLLTDAVSREIASALADAPDKSASVVLASLEAADPRAAQALAAAMIGEGSQASAEDDYDALVTRLQMFDLESRIASGKSRLRRGEGFADAAAYDDLFGQVAEMERQLAELKRRIRDDV